MATKIYSPISHLQFVNNEGGRANSTSSPCSVEAMDSATLTVSSSVILRNSSQKILQGRKFQAGLCFERSKFSKIFAIYPNGSACGSASGEDSSAADVHRRRSTFESLFCYDKAIPEERIEKPIGISLAEKIIGDNPRCTDCHAKGAVLCTTCSGSGLYVDSILESQGIIVKVRCLGCGGTGNIMCSECGGRGHLGSK